MPPTVSGTGTLLVPSEVSVVERFWWLLRSSRLKFFLQSKFLFPFIQMAESVESFVDPDFGPILDAFEQFLRGRQLIDTPIHIDPEHFGLINSFSMVILAVLLLSLFMCEDVPYCVVAALKWVITRVHFCGNPVCYRGFFTFFKTVFDATLRISC